MSMDEFDVQVAWPGAQPSPFGGDGASTAQESIPEEPAAAAEGEDELTPPEPFYFDSGVQMAQKDETSTDQIRKPSPAPMPDDAILVEDTQPSAPALEHEQPTSQDSSAAPVLDLNDDQPQEDQDI